MYDGVFWELGIDTMIWRMRDRECLRPIHDPDEQWILPDFKKYRGAF